MLLRSWSSPSQLRQTPSTGKSKVSKAEPSSKALAGAVMRVSGPSICCMLPWASRREAMVLRRARVSRTLFIARRDSTFRKAARTMMTITKAAAMTRASTREKPERFALGVEGFLTIPKLK